MMDLLTRYFQAEADPAIKTSSAGPLNLRVQSAALDVLQMLVSRGDATRSSLDDLKVALVKKLVLAIQLQQLSLQNKMLHLLHSTISATESKRHRTTSSTSSLPDAFDSAFERSLVSIIIEGISSLSNRPVLQHWIDFVLMTIPQFQGRQALLLPLCDCFSQQLRLAMLHIREVYIAGMADVRTTMTEAEPIMLLNGLERTVMLLPRGSRVEEKDGGSGILGYMTTVFTADVPSALVSCSWIR
jgi:hypothetical protein